MAKIDITRTELVWPGKYNEDGTLKQVPPVKLPFQVVETVNQHGERLEAGWRNRLAWGDNLLVMGSLLDEFAGKVDLIYIDPPFATGGHFSLAAKIGVSDEQIVQGRSGVEVNAYRDTWGRQGVGRELDGWMEMMLPRIHLMRDLLSASGSVYVHVDYRVSAPLRLLMDEVFGAKALRGWIVWQTGTGAKGRQQWSNQHNDLLCYSKGPEFTFNCNSPDLREPFAEVSQAMHFNKLDQDGRRYRERIVNGRSYIYHADEGRLVGSVWTDCPSMAANSPILAESVGYPTQKPEKLLRRVLSASSKPGDLIADLFCGSGTTLAVAEKLGRRWIGCDLGRWGIHVTRKRLLGIANCGPFQVLDLGKHERKYWQGTTFGMTKSKSLIEQVHREYVAFILKLYGAQPITGGMHLHGKKGKAMVHIGAVDSLVTVAEIVAAVDECVKFKRGELHVLGWEWEMGLYDRMIQATKKEQVELLLLRIPREVTERQVAATGDVRFFELARIEAEIKTPKRLSAQVALKDFIIPKAKLIPKDFRSKVKKWSDYVDYWAVDWAFRNDAFMQGWGAYRTRRERELPLVSDVHTYEKGGEYRVLVKVIDIFGNDTTQPFDVQIG